MYLAVVWKCQLYLLRYLNYKKYIWWSRLFEFFDALIKTRVVHGKAAFCLLRVGFKIWTRTNMAVPQKLNSLIHVPVHEYIYSYTSPKCLEYIPRIWTILCNSPENYRLHMEHLKFPQANTDFFPALWNHSITWESTFFIIRKTLWDYNIPFLLKHEHHLQIHHFNKCPVTVNSQVAFPSKYTAARTLKNWLFWTKGNGPFRIFANEAHGLKH